MLFEGRIETSSEMEALIKRKYVTGGFDTTAEEHRRLLNHRVTEET